MRGISSEPRSSWVFDTIKSGDLHPLEGNADNVTAEGNHPIQQKRLPTRLRNLFQEEPSLPSDTYHLHALGQSRAKPSSSPSSTSPFGRERGGLQLPEPLDFNQEEFPTARPTEFSFPPKKNGVSKPSFPASSPNPGLSSSGSHSSDSDRVGPCICQKRKRASAGY